MSTRLQRGEATPGLPQAPSPSPAGHLWASATPGGLRVTLSLGHGLLRPGWRLSLQDTSQPGHQLPARWISLVSKDRRAGPQLPQPPPAPLPVLTSVQQLPTCPALTGAPHRFLSHSLGAAATQAEVSNKCAAQTCEERAFIGVCPTECFSVSSLTVDAEKRLPLPVPKTLESADSVSSRAKCSCEQVACVTVLVPTSSQVTRYCS